MSSKESYRGKIWAEAQAHDAEYLEYRYRQYKEQGGELPPSAWAASMRQSEPRMFRDLAPPAPAQLPSSVSRYEAAAAAAFRRGSAAPSRADQTRRMSRTAFIELCTKMGLNRPGI